MDFPQVPNTHALVMLLMTGVALFLLTRETIRLESSSLAILVMVVIGFEIFPFAGPRGAVEPITFFYGFGHEALIGGMGTTIGTSTNLLVMNAGGYKFSDFVRVGTPLTLLMWVVLTLVLVFAYSL